MRICSREMISSICLLAVSFDGIGRARLTTMGIFLIWQLIFSFCQQKDSNPDTWLAYLGKSVTVARKGSLVSNKTFIFGAGKKQGR